MSTGAAPSPAPRLPRLPVFGWAALGGARSPGTDCILDAPGRQFTTSGRAAILLALEALGIGPGDRVLLPSYHCPTMVAPAVERGAVPVFYPIDERGRPNLAALQGAELQGAKALLAAHFFGLPQPMEPLRRWCDAHGIALIEDCAHALFGRSGTRPIGAWGDLAIASLTKFLPVPEGGCLVANNGMVPRPLAPCGGSAQAKALLDIVEEGARHGRLTGLNGLVGGSLAALRRLRPARPGTPPAAAEDDVRPGQPASVSAEHINVALAHREPAAAARWVAQTLPLARIVQRRRERYAWLAQRLAGHAGLHPLLPQLPADCAPYVFPLWVDEPDPGYAELRRRGMPVFRWDRLWPGVPVIAGDQGVRWSHHVLQLACHQDLETADLEQLAGTLLALYGRPAAAGAMAPADATAPARPGALACSADGPR